MAKESIECLNAGCSNCKNGKVFVKLDTTNCLNLYSCPFFPLQHKASNGKFCSNFKCKTQGTKNLCQYCRRIKI